MRVKTVSGLGMFVKDLRKKNGWSQTELAQRAKVSRIWIGDLERGKPSLEIELVFRTLQVLGVSLDVSLTQSGILQEIL